MADQRLCTKCSSLKPLVQFHFRSTPSGARRPTYCKECLSKDRKKDRKDDAYKTWYDNYSQSKHRRDLNTISRAKPENKARQRKARKLREATPEAKARIAQVTKEWKETPGVRAQLSMRERFRRLLQVPDHPSTLPVSRAALLKRLEQTWQTGMSWENYGYREKDYTTGWDVDHIIPISAYDHSDELDVERCWSLRNLRAEWHTKNLTKTSKLFAYMDVPMNIWPRAWNGKPPTTC